MMNAVNIKQINDKMAEEKVDGYYKSMKMEIDNLNRDDLVQRAKNMKYSYNITQFSGPCNYHLMEATNKLDGYKGFRTKLSSHNGNCLVDISWENPK